MTSIVLPNSVTKIGKGAFYRCSGLTSVTIPDSVTEIGNGAFRGCFRLTNVTLPSSVKKIGKVSFENVLVRIEKDSPLCTKDFVPSCFVVRNLHKDGVPAKPKTKKRNITTAIYKDKFLLYFTKYITKIS